MLPMMGNRKGSKLPKHIKELGGKLWRELARDNRVTCDGGGKLMCAVSENVACLYLAKIEAPVQESPTRNKNGEKRIASIEVDASSDEGGSSSHDRTGNVLGSAIEARMQLSFQPRYQYHWHITSFRKTSTQ